MPHDYLLDLQKNRDCLQDLRKLVLEVFRTNLCSGIFFHMSCWKVCNQAADGKKDSYKLQAIMVYGSNNAADGT